MPTVEELRETYPTSTLFLSDRNELPRLLNSRRLFGCGVEIGVKQGEFSETLLNEWRGRLLLSVDPWREDAPEAYQDIANVPQSRQETFYHETVARLAPFGARSSICRMTSVDAAAAVIDYTMDFVYVDARHDYDAVMEDLNAWYSKVRPGGIFAGHDYLDGVYAAGVFAVKSAVDEFFGARGISVRHTHLDGPCLSWIVCMPEPA
jgi:hypothetical protein